MRFIESLRQTLEAEALARQELSDAREITEQTEITTWKQRGELQGKLRKQAEIFRMESGIEPLLSTFIDLIKQDPIRRGPKGLVCLAPLLPKPDSAIDTLGLVGGHAMMMLSGPKLDKDAIVDVVICGAPHSRVIKSENDSLVQVEHHVQYIVVETKPNGNIAFHFEDPSIGRIGFSDQTIEIPRTVWKKDKSWLEITLGKAFSLPHDYTHRTYH